MITYLQMILWFNYFFKMYFQHGWLFQTHPTTLLFFPYFCSSFFSLCYYQLSHSFFYYISFLKPLGNYI
ncbi:hypothetical protein CICLE_v10004078mg [Citrus x clementina]|uniref:Uncharacterized protein n=1 Tax=Citrus clementina TaxID=85681 RepID=V4T026_CITCL|nr:hypothetical protein CICLE_v10004078mg [Citrus x clementina]